ncbi:Lrp/AsnC family transcriptional regulator [archaeon]|jgi:DNA-binding Lrp family transcriptional regulator|nr:Lrp/AsnC family transcriptional regulator [archaeon]MBT4397623.1 Lrp/AsnC family transcriptional regulator [archaeon]MBT4441078.1 Lrp/AsnC family transcriptional regulator [archaeon]
MIKLDKKDRRILYELELNGRITESRLAKKTRLSREVVRYRLGKLEKIGIIKYYMTLVNSLNLGFLMFRTYYRFTNLTLEKEKEIIEYLQKKVNWVTKVEGVWNLTTMSFSSSIFEYEGFLTELKMKYGEYIQDYWVSIMTKLWHYKRGFLLDKKKGEFALMMGERENKIKLDELDIKILGILLNNGRIKYIDLARKLKEHPKLIRDRVNRMIKEEVILGVTPYYDMSKLEMIYFKVHFNLKNYSMKEFNSLLRYAQDHPNIVHVVEAVGGADYEIEVQVKSNNELYDIIEDIKIKFADIIYDYYFMEYTKEHTLDYLPREMMVK